MKTMECLIITELPTLVTERGITHEGTEPATLHQVVATLLLSFHPKTYRFLKVDYDRARCVARAAPTVPYEKRHKNSGIQARTTISAYTASASRANRSQRRVRGSLPQPLRQLEPGVIEEPVWASAPDLLFRTVGVFARLRLDCCLPSNTRVLNGTKPTRGISRIH